VEATQPDRLSSLPELLPNLWPIVGADVSERQLAIHTCSRESCPRECAACRLEVEGWRLLFLSYATELGLADGEWVEVERGAYRE